MTRPYFRHVTIVGASLAGLRAAGALRAEGFDGELTILGAERHPPYDRPPLSKDFLAGSPQPESLALRKPSDLDAEWLLGREAVRLDPRERVVETSAHERVSYDGLVIATGSSPRRLPHLLPDDWGGVFELRTLDDAVALRDVLLRRPRVVIVGGGFIGVEMASTCRSLGCDVAVVTLDPPLAAAGRLVSDIAVETLRDNTVDVRVGRSVTGVVGDSWVEGVVLDDGSRMTADVVVIAVGAVPVTGWLRRSGLAISDGVICDRWGFADGHGRVVAAGDVARWPNGLFDGRSMRVEHWTNAVEQGMTAARNLLRGPEEAVPYMSVPSFWSDHFGMRVQSVGLPGEANRAEVVEGSAQDRRFVAALYRDNALVGAVGYGAPAGVARYRAALCARRPAAPVG